MLLAAGADPNAKGHMNTTPLHTAASYHYRRIQYTYATEQRKRLKVVRELLSAGADPNVYDDNMYTPIWKACTQGFVDIVKELLSVGADPNTTIKYGKTLIDAVIMSNGLSHYKLKPSVYIHIIKVLMFYGINVYDTYDMEYYYNMSGMPGIIELLDNYTPALQALSLKSVMRHKIDITSLPPLMVRPN